MRKSIELIRKPRMKSQRLRTSRISDKNPHLIELIIRILRNKIWPNVMKPANWSIRKVAKSATGLRKSIREAPSIKSQRLRTSSISNPNSTGR